MVGCGATDAAGSPRQWLLARAKATSDQASVDARTRDAGSLMGLLYPTWRAKYQIGSAGLTQPTQPPVAGTMSTCRGFGVSSCLFRSYRRRAQRASAVRRTPPPPHGPANSIHRASPGAASRTPSSASAAPATRRTAARPSAPKPQATSRRTARTVTRFRRNAASRFNPARRAAIRMCGVPVSSKAAKLLGP